MLDWYITILKKPDGPLQRMADGIQRPANVLDHHKQKNDRQDGFFGL